jgi:hypothetical protein
MYEFFQPFEESKVIAPVAIFAPRETIKIQQCKYQKLAQFTIAPIKNIIIACSTDGRLRAFINENLSGKINEDEEFEDFEGVEVSVRESDEEEDDDSEYDEI